VRKKRNDLQELLQSLSEAEIKACKTQISLYPSVHNSSLLHLFDGLRKSGSDEDKIIKKALRNLSSGANQAKYKKILTDLVQQTLVASRHEATVETRLHYMLETEKILYGKSLFMQCSRLLEEARSIASLYDYHLIELEILKRQGSILKHLFPDDFRVTQQQITARRKELLRLIDCETDYRNLAEMIFLLYRKYNLCRSDKLKAELLKLQNHSLLQNPNKALNFRSQRFYHSAHSYIYTLLGEREKILEHVQQNYLLWQKHPHQQKEKQEAYFSSLNHLCNSLMRLDRFEEAKQILQESDTISAIGKIGESNRFRQLKLIQLTLYNNTADFKAIPPLLKEIKQGLAAFEVPESYALSLIYNAALSCFIMGNYKETIQWLLRVQNDYGKKGERQDVRNFSSLFMLIAWYCAGMTDSVDNHLRSAKRFFTQQDLLFPLEDMMLRYLPRLLEAINSPAETKRIAQEFHQDVVGLKPQPLGCAETALWLKSVATGEQMVLA